MDSRKEEDVTPECRNGDRRKSRGRSVDTQLARDAERNIFTITPPPTAGHASDPRIINGETTIRWISELPQVSGNWSLPKGDTRKHSRCNKEFGRESRLRGGRPTPTLRDHSAPPYRGLASRRGQNRAHNLKDTGKRQKLPVTREGAR